MARNSSNLASMSVDALLRMRDEIGDVLGRKVDELKHQLSQLTGGSEKPKNGRRGRVHALKGSKVAPKYRDPETGATWAGRGARPRWMQAYVKDGRSPDEFAVAGATAGAKAARKKMAVRKTRKSKNSE
jgi:DNA-binding protein H-NS